MREKGPKNATREESDKDEEQFRVADPYSFDTDPDPASYVEYRSRSGSKVLMTKYWKKI
jgi:hypothetical protein